ncbi:MAG: hypothetical protein K0Q77_2977 [Anaerosporomusa subterranea]|jgi:hypothetical protein|nr:hypothetical protein [Anaerosporomusa subterranea]
MSIVKEILQNVALPKMIPIRQRFSAVELVDPAATLRQQIRRPDISNRIRKGMKIAVAVGSRGMAEIPLIARVVIEEIRRLGAIPFIVPAMGSHGGATAEGQKQVLASLGVTEETAGCPIISSMDVVELGVLDNGLAVLMDKQASQADGIIVINRVKAHNAFSGPVESGLTKIIAIGLGKQKGADSCHTYGFNHMAEMIVAMTKIKLQRMPFLFGIGTVENAYDRIAKIEVVPSETIIEADKRLLSEAKANMPKLLLQPVDVLIVDQLGKEFSGGGMDSHTIGRAATTCVFPAALPPKRLVVLDITNNSHGNACGMGLADLTTQRLFDKINFDFTYANNLTSTATESGRIPLIMDNDRLAIQGAVKTCNVPDISKLRMMRIPNSLHLERALVSESMLAEAHACADITIVGQAAEMAFDEAGNLGDLGFKTWRAEDNEY